MKIVLLCSGGESSAIVYDQLSRKFPIHSVIIEQPVSRSGFIKRRIKKLGFLKVMGQIAFTFFSRFFLKIEAIERKKEILKEYDVTIDLKKLYGDKSITLSSVNSKECIQLLKEIAPDLVVVNGTRIISEQVLNCINAIFINMHTGITPKYRGVHGAYWAYYNQDPEHAGVTIHLVDKGIDTGAILYQTKITKTEKDNFLTYPLLQTCVGVKDEIRAIEDLMNGELKIVSNNLPSFLYTHPTLFQYLYHRIKHNVK